MHAGKVLEGVAAEEHYWVLWLLLADGQKMKLVAGGLVAIAAKWWQRHPADEGKRVRD